MLHKSDTFQPKVLFIAPQPFFEVRGTPMNVAEFVRRLGELGYETDLLVLPHGQDLELAGVRIVRCLPLPGVKTVSIGMSLKKALYDIALLAHAIYLCCKNRYLVVQGVEEGALIAAIVGKIFKIPYIVDMDSFIPEEISQAKFFGSKALAKGYDLLQRCAIRKAALVITVSSKLTEYVRRVAPKTAVAQIEDCPLERPATKISPEELPCKRESAMTYLYTGNLESYQGVDLLLAAFGEIRAKEQTVLQRSRLIIVGGTELQIKSYQSMAAKLGLESFITFLGQRPSSEMYDLMDIADFLVSPRLFGGNTPLKIYSYMESGKPIVATAIDAHTSLLSDEEAFLAEPTSQSLADVLLATLALHQEDSEEPKRRSANAKSLLERSYSRDAFRQKIDNAYLSLFSRIEVEKKACPVQAEELR